MIISNLINAKIIYSHEEIYSLGLELKRNSKYLNLFDAESDKFLLEMFFSSYLQRVLTFL